MSDDLSGFSLIELFRAEAESQTQTLSAGLLSLERGDASAATLESLMRAAHSIKGAARIVGLDAAVSVAHVVEDYFVAAQHHRIRIQSAHIDLLLRGVDLLNQIARLSENESAELAASQSKIADFVEELKAIINHPEAEPAAIVAEPPAKASPQIADIPELPESNRPPEKPAEPQEHVAPSLQPAPEASPKTPASDSVASPHPAPPAQMQAVVERSERVVRVTAENMTRLLGLAGESLVEARQFRPFVGALQAIKHEQATLWETLRSLEEHLGNGAADSRDLVLDLLARAQERSSECQNELNERIREIDDFAHRSEDLAGRLHHEIVASRMRPLADGTKGFPRLVRDLARQLGKSVHFEIKGDETGVDRDVLEKLEAPLNHLIRNALDHGIESAEERARAGKPGTGQICLQACHRAGMLQITLRDDGRGIDAERIRAKVVERGLVSRAMAQQLSELELFDFLFLPGFTTSPSVTEISGRGVGLDVVQNMVTGLGGSVRAASIPGRETTFTLRLPITMSVIRALLAQIG
ncbi:MAG: hybrid sensor histidine kinase/response regulator, partial [Acidobacteria bacterium]